jgi:hypothetical protein
MTPAPQVTYFAISILSSRTFWINAGAFLLAVLSAADVVAVLPIRWQPWLAAGVAVVNIGLRLATVRPAALIRPGTSKPIAVTKIDPPSPALVTD